MPQPNLHQTHFETGVKYVCNQKVFADVYETLYKHNQRPYVIMIDGSDIAFRVLDRRGEHG